MLEGLAVNVARWWDPRPVLPTLSTTDLSARIAGLPHAQVAEQMGCTVGAVRQLLGRAMVKLSELLPEDSE